MEADTTAQVAPETATEDTRAAALAALEGAAPEATAEPAVAESKAETPEAAELAAPVAKEETKDEAEQNRIAVIMRARAKAERTRRAAEEEASLRARQLEERERKLAEREESVKAKLRAAPLDALRELGIDPREFLENAIKDPERLEPVSQLKQEIEEIRRQNQELVNSIKQEREEAQRREAENHRESVRQQFVRETIGGDDFKALKAFYSNNPRGLVARAEALIGECVSRGLDPNEISNREVAEYLEQEAREHYNSLKRQFEQLGAEPTQAVDGNVTLSGKATAPKLSRSKKTLAEMSEDERRAEALRALEQG